MATSLDAPIESVDSLALRIRAYHNGATENDRLYLEFTAQTDAREFLRKHRDFVEQNAWGFGDRAFHYMWFLILQDLAQRFRPVEALEIGVYKGQVLSLWALLARHLGIEVAITGISPFQGNLKRMSVIERKIRRLLDSQYKANLHQGNLYPEDDYLHKVREIFARFALDADRCHLIRGYSTDPGVIAAVAQRRFSLIYIDGDHSYEGVCSDINTYAPLLEDGGYLVMDDASCFIPGTVFWKGREGVSRACDLIPSLGFENVLNVGHDRIYRKIPAAQAAVVESVRASGSLRSVEERKGAPAH